MANPITFIPTTSTAFGKETEKEETSTITDPVTSISTSVTEPTTIPPATDADEPSTSDIILYIVIPVIAIAFIVSIFVVRLRAVRNWRGVLRRRTSEVLQLPDEYVIPKRSFSDVHENANESDMFGRSWGFIKPLSSLNDQFYISETGVSVCFHKYSNQYESELKRNINFSVHNNFKALSSALNINNYQMLVSPAVELSQSSESPLPGHVILQLPLCKLETFSSLGVHWISTPLTSFATLKDIPYEKEPSSSSLDCFYTLLDNGIVRVYTNHFSLFFCTCCKSDLRFELSAQACARVGMIDGYPTLQIKLLFMGLQNRLNKREENGHDLDRKKGFNVIETGEINLLKKQNSKKNSGFLKCRLSTLLEERCPKWEHIKRGENQCPIYQPEQVVDVAELIRCWQKEHELCYCINWYLKCEKRYCHRLPIVIDVENTRHLTKNAEKIQTIFTMEVDISTGLNMLQDPIRTLIDSIGHEKVRQLLDMLELRSNQERGRVEDEKEHWYETLSAIRTDPHLSRRLSSAMATVDVEWSDQNMFGFVNAGFVNAKSGQENQRTAQNEPYDYPETNSLGSSYAEVDSHFNANYGNREPSYLSFGSTANDSVRTKKSKQLSPSSNNVLAFEGHVHDGDVNAKSNFIPELKDRANHVLIERLTPLGASNDSDETERKDIVDSDLDGTKQKEIVGSDSDETKQKEIVDSDSDETKQKEIVDSDSDERKQKEIVDSDSDETKKKGFVESDSDERNKKL